MTGDIQDMKTLIGHVAGGDGLSEEQAERAFDIIMSGDATPAQIGGFLMALRVRGETVAEITGAARMTCEIILISAYDFPNVKWKENGWEWAEQRSAEIKKSLDEGADWKETLEHFSEFWDPPIPDTGHTPQFGRLFKGVFTNQTRNQMLQMIGESEYTIFMRGSALADDIFFEQERGTIAGPFKGPHGYYISKYISKSPPSSPLNLREPVHRDIAVEYYVRYKMNEKVQELLAAGREDGSVLGL